MIQCVMGLISSPVPGLCRYPSLLSGGWNRSSPLRVPNVSWRMSAFLQGTLSSRVELLI